MGSALEEQLGKSPEKVRAVLNILLESPYFYRGDAEELFMYLRRHRKDFGDFFREYYGWELIADDKCARLYKGKWYNPAVLPVNRRQFQLSNRDECIGFMLLIEFFEHQLEENAMTAEDRGNLCFTFGDLLEYEARRFSELFAGGGREYSGEYVRANVLRGLLPKLIQARFIRELPKPRDLEPGRDQYIYEALPALYHYNSGRLSGSVAGSFARAEARESSGTESPFTVSESWEEPDAGVDNLIEALDGERDA